MGKNVLKGATRTASKQQTNNQSEEQIGGVIRSFLGTGPSVDDMLDLPAPRSGSRNRVDLHATNASISSSLQFLPSARSTFWREVISSELTTGSKTTCPKTPSMLLNQRSYQLT